MGFNTYPYTDLHEMNLDWILKKVKEMIAEWGNTKNAWNALKEFVETYFENLDVQQEINNKLDEMAAGGELAELMQPYIDEQLPLAVADQIADIVALQIGTVVAAQLPDVVADQLPAIAAEAAAEAAAEQVGTWLESHVDPDTGYVIDDTLTTALAAADAKAAGTEIRRNTSMIRNAIAGVNDVHSYYDDSLSYYIGGANKWTDATATHFMIPVNPGDSVFIKGNGTRNAYFAVLTKFDVAVNNGTPAFSSDADFDDRQTVSALSEDTFTMPSDAAYLCINRIAIGNDYTPSKITVNGYDVLESTRAGITRINGIVYSQGISSGEDLDDVTASGAYRLAAAGTYGHQPCAGGRRLLIVSAKNDAGAPYQVLIQFNTGLTFYRMNHDLTWDEWKSVRDEEHMKITMGANPYRKALDHGGFYDTKYGSKLIYQNSPEAFRTAMLEGIVFHNLDVVFSSDGVPFVSHDVTVPESGGGTINLNNLTAAQIKTYQIGDSDYSWTPQTLAECYSFIKKIGGAVDMVDVTAANNETQITNAGNLPEYYRQYNIKATWTNFDYDDMRDAFINNGPEFGLYFVCNSEATILGAIQYVQEHPLHGKYCMNVAASNDSIRQIMVDNMITAKELGITLYAYTYNKSNVAYTPVWADGIVSENCNANYENWKSNM